MRYSNIPGSEVWRTKGQSKRAICFMIILIWDQHKLDFLTIWQNVLSTDVCPYFKAVKFRVLFVLEFWTPVALCCKNVWSLLVVRWEYAADLRFQVFRVSERSKCSLQHWVFLGRSPIRVDLLLTLLDSVKIMNLQCSDGNYCVVVTLPQLCKQNCTCRESWHKERLC